MNNSLSSFYPVRLKDLPLIDVEKRLSYYHSCLKRELGAKGVKIDFTLWLSDEWFCPDGVCGFALPFYLFHPDLVKIQKKETGLVEGKTEREILKLMRHELGHVVDNAFGLRADKQRQSLFGSSFVPYPESYKPQKYSTRFVHYLGHNYAQSHPDEDFAESFAYWLDPEKNWKTKNFSKTLCEKMEWLEEAMASLRHRRPLLKNKTAVDPIEKNTTVLKDFYTDYRSGRKSARQKKVDKELSAHFSKQKKSNEKELAVFLKASRKKMCREVSDKTGAYQYEVEMALEQVIARAQELGITATSKELRQKASAVVENSFLYLKDREHLQYYM